MSANIRFDEVTLGYDRRPAIHHLVGMVASGTLTAVVGPNGAGKSTLLKGIAGVLSPLSGAIRVEAVDRPRIAYLPQAASLDRSFPLSVYDLVAVGLWSNTGPFRGIGAAHRQKIETALAAVGLTGFERRPIGTLSGGQMQRALFARLLVQDAGVILLDEPFTAIDSGTTADLLDIVTHWHAEKRTVVAVLHDSRHGADGVRLGCAFAHEHGKHEVGWVQPVLGDEAAHRGGGAKAARPVLHGAP